SDLDDVLTPRPRLPEHDLGLGQPPHFRHGRQLLAEKQRGEDDVYENAWNLRPYVPDVFGNDAAGQHVVRTGHGPHQRAQHFRPQQQPDGSGQNGAGYEVLPPHVVAAVHGVADDEQQTQHDEGGENVTDSQVDEPPAEMKPRRG